MRQTDIYGIYTKTFASIDSTNTYAKNLLRDPSADFWRTENLQNGSCLRGLITANEQTAGRGRHGKSFSSLKDNGIYMTLILEVRRPAKDCLFLTSAAAIAVARVLERLCRVPAKIKWVNDIFVGEKKVCGILTEAVSLGQSGALDYAVVGIGINADAALSRMPEEVQAVAGSIALSGVTREDIIREVAEEVAALSDVVIQAAGEDLKQSAGKSGRPGYPDTMAALIAEYRARSMILGREIWWETDGRRYEGRAADINAESNLIVETAEGEIVLHSGLVSIRPGKETDGKDS